MGAILECVLPHIPYRTSLSPDFQPGILGTSFLASPLKETQDAIIKD
jgi:hypothetical protein